jgi:hypothetical protein
MRRTLTITAIAVAVVAIAAAGARAETIGRACTSAPADQYLSTGDLQAKVEAQGYKVTRVKIDKACGEVDGFDKAGAKVELFVDPANGTIVRTETD